MSYLISKEQKKISKYGLNQRYPVLCDKFENEKKEGQNLFDPPECEFKIQIFSYFPAYNFHRR